MLSQILKILLKNHYIDINECETTKPCHKDAICTDTIGSYTCKCKNGFEGDGINCKGRLT
jgi:hypothetical protein